MGLTFKMLNLLLQQEQTVFPAVDTKHQNIHQKLISATKALQTDLIVDQSLPASIPTRPGT